MDHYKTLGLSSDATKDQIKEAFRRCALKFHPDRHSQSSPEARDGASRRFQQASQAYEILSDDRRRMDYDLRRRAGWGPSSYHGAPRYGSGGGGGGGGAAGGGYPRPPRREGAASGFDLEFMFRYLTTRRFLMHAAFASGLLGGVVLIERSVETIWKMNNSGKSFEEAIDCIEKARVQKENN